MYSRFTSLNSTHEDMRKTTTNKDLSIPIHQQCSFTLLSGQNLFFKNFQTNLSSNFITSLNSMHVSGVSSFWNMMWFVTDLACQEYIFHLMFTETQKNIENFLNINISMKEIIKISKLEKQLNNKKSNFDVQIKHQAKMNTSSKSKWKDKIRNILNILKLISTKYIIILTNISKHFCNNLNIQCNTTSFIKTLPRCPNSITTLNQVYSFSKKQNFFNSLILKRKAYLSEKKINFNLNNNQKFFKFFICLTSCTCFLIQSKTLNKIKHTIETKKVDEYGNRFSLIDVPLKIDNFNISEMIYANCSYSGIKEDNLAAKNQSFNLKNILLFGVMDLSNNFMNHIPSSISNYTNLKALFLHNNFFAMPNPYILRLKNLKVLTISSNPWRCSCVDIVTFSKLIESFEIPDLNDSFCSDGRRLADVVKKGISVKCTSEYLRLRLTFEKNVKQENYFYIVLFAVIFILLGLLVFLYKIKMLCAEKFGKKDTLENVNNLKNYVRKKVCRIICKYRSKSLNETLLKQSSFTFVGNENFSPQMNKTNVDYTFYEKEKYLKNNDSPKTMMFSSSFERSVLAGTQNSSQGLSIDAFVIYSEKDETIVTCNLLELLWCSYPTYKVVLLPHISHQILAKHSKNVISNEDEFHVFLSNTSLCDDKEKYNENHYKNQPSENYKKDERRMFKKASKITESSFCLAQSPQSIWAFSISSSAKKKISFRKFFDYFTTIPFKIHSLFPSNSSQNLPYSFNENCEIAEIVSNIEIYLSDINSLNNKNEWKLYSMNF